MTKTRAELLTGYEVRRLEPMDQDKRVVYGAFRGDELIGEAAHLTDDLALQILVREIYTVHSLEVLKQHGWRCARCRGARRLQIHHRKYRSHGGTHRIENLEPVCWECHKLIHKLERSK
jgi:hypothetical protein